MGEFYGFPPFMHLNANAIDFSYFGSHQTATKGAAATIVPATRPSYASMPNHHHHQPYTPSSLPSPIRAILHPSLPLPRLLRHSILRRQAALITSPLVLGHVPLQAPLIPNHTRIDRPIPALHAPRSPSNQPRAFILPPMLPIMSHLDATLSLARVSEARMHVRARRAGEIERLGAGLLRERVGRLSWDRGAGVRGEGAGRGRCARWQGLGGEFIRLVGGRGFDAGFVAACFEGLAWGNAGAEFALALQGVGVA